VSLDEIRDLCSAAANESGMLIVHGDARSKLLAASRTILPKLLDYVQVIEDAIEQSPDDFMLRGDLMQRFREVRQSIGLESP
jgi:hypothetical protein